MLTWIAQPSYGGWFRPYWFCFLIAFIVVIAISFYGFYKRKMPTTSLYKGIFIMVPFSLLGASFFGKIGIRIYSVSFLELFAFWEPGMSIHGGLIFGLLAGVIYFYFEAKRYNISLWVYADRIVPHLLLGQAIGRWGNFFNHELLGQPISRSQLMWLPSFIRDNLFKFCENGYQALGINGQCVDVTDVNKIQYFEPIFLYESFANLLLWIIIVFLIPLVFKYLPYFRFKKEEPEFERYSVKGLWDKWYYDIVVDPLITRQICHEENLKKIYLKTTKNLGKWDKFKAYLKYKKDRIAQIWKRDYSKLEKLHNPHRLKILRCGTQTGLYIFGYNLIRLILETRRMKEDYFIRYDTALNFTVLSLMIFLGVIMVIFTQYISVKKFRNGEWLYEKQY